MRSREPEPLERGGGDDDGVELGGLLEPGGDVAAQLGEVRSGRSAASCARRRTEPVPTRAPGGQRVERRADERVAGVAALGHRREHQAVGR